MTHYALAPCVIRPAYMEFQDLFKLNKQIIHCVIATPKPSQTMVAYVTFQCKCAEIPVLAARTDQEI